MHRAIQTIRQLGAGVLVALLWLASIPVQAQEVKIANTGYVITLPDDYAISRPSNAPHILVQGGSPAGDANVQVIHAASGVPAENLAQDYENKMGQA